MNKEKILEIAKEVGLILKTTNLSLCASYTTKLEAFANRIMQECGSGEAVACMYVNDDGECEEIGHLDNYNGLVPDEFTPLYIHPKNDDCELLQAKIDELMLEYCPDVRE